MYRTFIMYCGNVYRSERNIFKNNDCIVTRFKEKTDGSFYEHPDNPDSCRFAFPDAPEKH